MRTTINSKLRERHQHAKIINLSGHRLPDDAIARIKELHSSYSIYSIFVSVDMDEDLTDQCTVIIRDLLEERDIFGDTVIQSVGELYYAGPGHSQTNLMIYQAIQALFGYAPHLISIGVNMYKFQTYELKRCYDIQRWSGRWRSIERNRYLKTL